MKNLDNYITEKLVVGKNIIHKNVLNLNKANYIIKKPRELTQIDSDIFNTQILSFIQSYLNNEQPIYVFFKYLQEYDDEDFSEKIKNFRIRQNYSDELLKIEPKAISDGKNQAIVIPCKNITEIHIFSYKLLKETYSLFFLK